MMGQMSARARWGLVAVFATAMAWMEAATVFYIRSLVGRIQTEAKLLIAKKISRVVAISRKRRERVARICQPATANAQRGTTAASP